MHTKISLDIDDLIAECGRQSLTHKLKAMHPDIEKAIAAGVTHQDILKALKKKGYGEISLATFRTTLYRLRRKNKVVTATSSSAESQLQAGSPHGQVTQEMTSNPEQNSSASDSARGKQLSKMQWNELTKLDVKF